VTDNNPQDSARYESIKAPCAWQLQRRRILRDLVVARTHPNVGRLDRAIADIEGVTIGALEELINVAKRMLWL
jgi:hypothetical protein